MYAQGRVAHKYGAHGIYIHCHSSPEGCYNRFISHTPDNFGSIYTLYCKPVWLAHTVTHIAYSLVVRFAVLNHKFSCWYRAWLPRKVTSVVL